MGDKVRTLKFVCMSAAFCAAWGVAQPAAAACDPVGEIRFICDLVSPEDFAIVPGDEWVIASGDREGGRIQLVHVRDKTATAVFPAPGAAERLDAATYPTCPGPIDPNEGDEFRAHGLYLRTSDGNIHTLYVVHHGLRESIEVFEVDTAGAKPSVLMGNASPLGIEVSADGQVLYIAGWAEEKLTRLSRGRTPLQKDVVPMGFRPDNLRMSADGSFIFAAGHGNVREPRDLPQETSNVAKVDPQTLEVRRIFQHPHIDDFGGSTAAIQIGDELWLGTYRGKMIAYLPAPE